MDNEDVLLFHVAVSFHSTPLPHRLEGTPSLSQAKLMPREAFGCLRELN
jgi:hypothetical protein